MTNNDFDLLAELKEANDAFERSLNTFSSNTKTLTQEIAESGSKADAAMTAIAAWLEEKAKQQ